MRARGARSRLMLGRLVMGRLALGLAALTAAGCTTVEAPRPGPVNDGELVAPADYRTWARFLSAVQRPDAKQVREIYMNEAGARGTPGGGFPSGTVFVMENYAAQADPDGTLKLGADGKLLKGELQRVFVMGKNEGWGQNVAEALRNGNWVYASWMGDGRTRSPEDLNTCRVCHLPIGARRDFVHRFDEHFAQRR